MDKKDQRYQDYVSILKKELVPAMGCTEPIAIAFAAALAKEKFNQEIDAVDIYASGNIIKNVKSVIVPNTGGRKGIPVAAVVGIIAGDASKNLEVISEVSEEQRAAIDTFMKEKCIRVHPLKCENALELEVIVSNEKSYCKVKVAQEHSNVVLIEKNQEILFEKSICGKEQKDEAYASLSMEDIYDFALTADLDDVKDILQRQIDYNTAIAKEGIEKCYGAGIANMLLKVYGDSVQVKARAMAAAGSDARMSGCELPVIINSGSGNQGMSASLPVIVYAKELQKSKEELYRALLISNLSTIYQKQFIGRLSAYCGAVSAGAGAGAGIAYLLGGNYENITHTIVNALAITSGMICDGAKPSCAAKIASAVDAGIMGCYMYQCGKQFYCGEGIVQKGIKATIESVGELARKGMKGTDEEIIELMIKNDK
ncbi:MULTISPECIES: serine dehydratase subunit alpha family protein [Bacillota]|uniref:UPF0597 protein LQE99_12800 n=1 Tax=Amedibacillus hominis TaxID=2897776 RepID=A0ABS9R8L7_9FIRM|nr:MULTISPECIES: L-serine ammonia-lyase, iron-sulfur-dependent, subunit alpha [Bacillota]MCH4286000.1 L-serine ammonia-lyase, iron-sulfur-dependent, subunit alpha [Amedibacillus hominis]RGB51390.1 serine dehydratase subunit alpha family protein [Absiella sp. AM22-9]RGB57847.1 serine dehydratase subunit alpha family protein [Absiella sp. AM10-20]RGB65655.1 serine dehydratase subunit alpha family protein [Absiella sp. AM09-45]RGB76044.1 serine dehydratase subunit alpha family protein [Absiella s